MYWDTGICKSYVYFCLDLSTSKWLGVCNMDDNKQISNCYVFISKGLHFRYFPTNCYETIGLLRRGDNRLICKPHWYVCAMNPSHFFPYDIRTCPVNLQMHHLTFYSYEKISNSVLLRYENILFTWPKTEGNG